MKLFAVTTLSILVLSSLVARANELIPITSLNNTAHAHTTTVLGNGNVVNIGLNVEIYDPVTQVWTVIAPLNFPRIAHTATLLDNNTIVVAGGRGLDSTVLDSVEIYDIANDLWTVSNPMQQHRLEHIATLLDDGRILVSGGSTAPDISDFPLASSEIFDPVSQTWSSAGSMSDRRSRHQQVLLDNGEVLAAGGRDLTANSQLPLASADIYNPDTNRWRAAASMLNQHASGSMIKLLNGNVLMAAGSRSISIGNNSFLPEAHAQAEIYDPLTNTWSATNDMNVARRASRATRLCDGKVLVTGGLPLIISGRGTPITNSAEVYDPEFGTWEEVGPMLRERVLHTATLLNDCSVMLAGGQNNPSPGNTGVRITKNVSVFFQPKAEPEPEELALDTGAEGQLLLQGLSVFATTIPLYRRSQSVCSKAYPEVSKEFENAFTGDNFSLLEKSLKNLFEKRLKIFGFGSNAVSANSMSKDDCIQLISQVSSFVKSLDSNKAGVEDLDKLIDYVNGISKLSDSGLNEYITQIETNIIKARKEAIKKRSSNNKARPSPVEKNKNFDELFNKIVNASRKSYESGDWSIFANLYDAGSFSCFDDTESNDSYVYLSMLPISEDATYEVFTREAKEGSKFTGLSYTMKVASKFSYKSRCNEPGIGKRFPRKTFDVINEDGNLKLTDSYSCPREHHNEGYKAFLSEARQARAKDKELLLVSKEQFESALSRLTKDDWLSVPEQIKKDQFPLKTVYRIQNKYNLNVEIAHSVINYICDTHNTWQK